MTPKDIITSHGITKSMKNGSNSDISFLGVRITSFLSSHLSSFYLNLTVIVTL
jgi:hypothetical protein